MDHEILPTSWYNVLPDLPRPLDPPLHPATGKPVGPDDLAAIFPQALIEQEVSDQRWIPIPPEVLEVYARWRPTPLKRARALEKALDTPARIYYKAENTSPAGSHKPNTAVAQAYYNKREGIKRLVTETGAGQWGSALAMACCFFGLDCRVYMVRVSYEQKPHRKTLIELWGGEIFPSPSTRTAAGRAALEADPDSPGSLGIAISEAVEEAAGDPQTNYSLGSVLNHVLLHQSVIGLEAKAQLKAMGEAPDVIIGCIGGGSNFAGLALPFVPEKLEGKNIRIVAVEPASCPTVTKGIYAYDFGDNAGLTPMLKMHTLGHSFVPPAIHAGGLRYHGMAPIVSLLAKEGVVDVIALHQLECFEAGVLFARTEGVVPAPESTHAIRAAIEEALRAKEEGTSRVIIFNLSGHGHFDMSAYEAYLAGALSNYDYPAELVQQALKSLPKL